VNNNSMIQRRLRRRNTTHGRQDGAGHNHIDHGRDRAFVAAKCLRWETCRLTHLPERSAASAHARSGQPLDISKGSVPQNDDLRARVSVRRDARRKLYGLVPFPPWRVRMGAVPFQLQRMYTEDAVNPGMRNIEMTTPLRF